MVMFVLYIVVKIYYKYYSYHKLPNGLTKYYIILVLKITYNNKNTKSVEKVCTKTENNKYTKILNAYNNLH